MSFTWWWCYITLRKWILNPWKRFDDPLEKKDLFFHSIYNHFLIKKPFQTMILLLHIIWMVKWFWFLLISWKFIRYFFLLIIFSHLGNFVLLINQMTVEYLFTIAKSHIHIFLHDILKSKKRDQKKGFFCIKLIYNDKGNYSLFVDISVLLCKLLIILGTTMHSEKTWLPLVINQLKLITLILL